MKEKPSELFLSSISVFLFPISLSKTYTQQVEKRKHVACLKGELISGGKGKFFCYLFFLRFLSRKQQLVERETKNNFSTKRKSIWNQKKNSVECFMKFLHFLRVNFIKKSSNEFIFIRIKLISVFMWKKKCHQQMSEFIIFKTKQDNSK